MPLEQGKQAEIYLVMLQNSGERSAKMKKIFTVVVCVILVLALGIPTIALSVLTA